MEGMLNGTAGSKSSSIFLQIAEHPDGTITRPAWPLLAPSPGPDEERREEDGVLLKDVELDADKDTWVRLYLPKSAATPTSGKLPVVAFLHGGGFVLFGPSALLYHGFCLRMARSLPALVASISYRLAPEHPLPAAYHDALHALAALPSIHPWVTDHADPATRLFLMGSSSGGNIAYHAALHAPPLIKISGLVLHQPYFGGEARTASEAASEEDPVLPLRSSDMMWRLSLPAGADRDHEFCNPKAAAAEAAAKLPRCLVKGSAGDPLVDRGKNFAAMLDRAGVSLTASFDEDGFHAAELFVEKKADELFDELRVFVYGDDQKTSAAAAAN